MQSANSVIIFFQNSPWLLLAIIALPLFYLAFSMTKKTVKGLKAKISDYYPFNLILPKSTTWSSLFLLIIVSILALVLYLVAQKGLVLTPA